MSEKPQYESTTLTLPALLHVFFVFIFIFLQTVSHAFGVLKL